MGQSIRHAAVHAASTLERPDLLELWRIADRIARQAEIRLGQHLPQRAQVPPASAARDEAVVLRQRANELLRAAIGDFDGRVRDLNHTAQSLRA